ncbi:troponin C-like isoform X2 [Apis cerana]|uniref:troponin C-like isoform X2 n=1 Tax=Apis cerana TaxID=7461 RepID=UPI002B23E97A|nr:troponin C-like isoform X2 [Apis cerana]
MFNLFGEQLAPAFYFHGMRTQMRFELQRGSIGPRDEVVVSTRISGRTGSIYCSVASNNNTGHIRRKFSLRKRTKMRIDETIPTLVVLTRVSTLLRRAFSMFDSTKSGRIEKEKVRTILNTLGHTFDDHELEVLLKQEDEEGSGKLNFDSFYRVACHFQEEDDEALQKELKEAFRLYDKEGNGYIPTSSLREILAALDDQITPDQMDGMIAEIDTDGSGTVDFDEFMEMMTGD